VITNKPIRMIKLYIARATTGFPQRPMAK